MPTSDWTYRSIPFDASLIPDKAIGFIYKITNDEGKAYIGKKLLYFKKTSVKTLYRKLKKGETGKGAKFKKKTVSQVQSDWPTYWSSSERLVADVKLRGEDAFTREILFFCSSKGGMGYWEAQMQMDLRVLENQDKWYNGIVSCRIHWRHITEKIE
jgi:hypothetical protein